VDLMLATGARIGEILDLRWEDLDLAAERPTLTICGTLVFVKGQGFFRQPWTKSDAGWRMVVLPRFAVGMIMARKLVAADNPHDAIFASRRGTWLSPNNVRRQWREARADTDLAWVTPHTFRKTVATLIKEGTDTKNAAAQLGHSSEEVSPARTTSPSPPKPRTSRTSSSDPAPTTGGGNLPHPPCPTMRIDDEPGSRPQQM